jgi:hypothetical protein
LGVDHGTTGYLGKVQCEVRTRSPTNGGHDMRTVTFSIILPEADPILAREHLVKVQMLSSTSELAALTPSFAYTIQLSCHFGHFICVLPWILPCHSFLLNFPNIFMASSKSLSLSITCLMSGLNVLH